MKILTKIELKRILDRATSVALCSPGEVSSAVKVHPSCKGLLLVIEK